MRTMMLGLIAAVLLSASSLAQPAPSQDARATLPFIHDTGRLLVELSFRTRDGNDRPALAWVNLGTPKAAVSPALRHDLPLAPGQPLRLRFGSMAIEIPGDAIADQPPDLGGEDVFSHLFGPRVVDAILPASALMTFEVEFDFGAHRMTLARPGVLHPQGVATPVRLAPDTGIIAVDAMVGGDPVTLAIDTGAPFTWLRGDIAAPWLAARPDRRRAEGAVGASNMGLVDLAFEQRATLMRLPDVAIGSLHLPDVGALATAPLLCRLCDRLVGDLFWDGWAANAPGQVVGWIGNNVLDDFRLTIDYPNRTVFWLRQRPTRPNNIDQVGVSLVRQAGAYIVGGIVEKEGRSTVEGARAGDRLIAIDGRDPQGAGSDDVGTALGGAPGTRHRLMLDRNGLPVTIDAAVTRF